MFTYYKQLKQLGLNHNQKTWPFATSTPGTQKTTHSSSKKQQPKLQKHILQSPLRA